MKQPSFWIEWGLLAMAALLLLSALLVPLAAAQAACFTEDEQRLLDAYRNNDVIRLHILASSDSPEDQTVKYAVRDAILEKFGQKLANAENVYQQLLENVPAIEETARQTAAASGYDGQISAEAGWLRLPEKTYGRVVLPEGYYRGLRITLGQGKGENWWCVLYPKLCLDLLNEQQPPRSLRWFCTDVLRHWLLTPVQTAKNVI